MKCKNCFISLLGRRCSYRKSIYAAFSIYLGRNDDSNQGGKIAGIAIGTGIGGILILACCFTLCVSGASFLFCFKSNPFLSNKDYVSSGLIRHIGNDNSMFQSGLFSNYYVKDGSWYGPYRFSLGFYPNAGHLVRGRGTDNIGMFTVHGIYSPRTRRMGLDKHYQNRIGDANANARHTKTIQVQWNSATQSFEGKYYLKNGEHWEEQKYVIRATHVNDS